MPPIPDPAVASPAPGVRQPDITAAFAALLIGAVAMGGSVVFVRLADVGPFTSAFWRVTLALPFLFLWMSWEDRNMPARPQVSMKRSLSGAVLLSGLFFAGDLVFWHLAILNTSVANATFMATTAPVLVILLSGWILREPPGRHAYAGLALCLAGGIALLGSTLTLQPDKLIGDFYGLVTAVFFAGYFLSVRIARRNAGTARVMFYSSSVTSVCLAVMALIAENSFLPAGVTGLLVLIGLALTAHALGQGLLTFSLGFLPAAFSSLVIFLEAVAAAAFGWLILAEALSAAQFLGGALIMLGIAQARPRRGKR